MSEKYTPVKGFILVKPLEDEQPEGFSIEDANPTPHAAKVLVVGPDTFHDHIGEIFKAPCRVGDEIIHSGFGFEDIRIEGEKYRLVPFGKVLAVKNKEEK